MSTTVGVEPHPLVGVGTDDDGNTQVVTSTGWVLTHLEWAGGQRVEGWPQVDITPGETSLTPPQVAELAAAHLMLLDAAGEGAINRLPDPRALGVPIAPAPRATRSEADVAAGLDDHARRVLALVVDLRAFRDDEGWAWEARNGEPTRPLSGEDWAAVTTLSWEGLMAGMQATPRGREVAAHLDALAQRAVDGPVAS